MDEQGGYPAGETLVSELDPVPVGMRAEPEPEPPVEPEPLTAEQLEEQVEQFLLQAELAVCMQTLQQEIASLAQASILKRLAPAGGVEHPQQIQKNIAVHQERIRILKQLRIELEEQKPLVTGGGLEVVNSGLIVPGA